MLVSEIEIALRKGFGDNLERAIEAYRPRVMEERGCLGCELSRSRTSAPGYVLRQTFKDDAALRHHERQPHTQELEARLAEICTERAEPRVSLLLFRSYKTTTQLPARDRESAWTSVTDTRSTELDMSFPELAAAAPVTSEQAPAPSRGKKKKGKSAPRSPTPQPFVGALWAKVERIELATATDGRFRGLPDPAFIVGLYSLNGVRPQLVGRLLYRLKMTRAAPHVTMPSEALVTVPIARNAVPLRLLVIAVGIEENGGEGVQRAYQALQEVESLTLSTVSSAEPIVSSLAEFCASVAPERFVIPVLPIADGEAVPDGMGDDVWVGASAAIVNLTATEHDNVVLFRLSTEAARNDWTASVRVSIGPASQG